MDLVATRRNPVPSGATAGRIVSFDGTGLRFARWQAAARGQKGTVCIFGGRTEFIEKYFETIADLRHRGFAVAALDWRGQGGSDRALRNRRKGHVEDFAEYDGDLECFMDEVVLPDCPPPYFALAHSMGGNVLLRAARRRDCWFERMVLTAPMVRLARLPLSLKATAAVVEVAVFLGLGELSAPGGKGQDWETMAFESNLLTSDERRFSRNREVLAAAPELGLGSPTVAWVRAALESMQMVSSDDFPPQVRVPLLMLAAGRDEVVSSQAIERLAAQLRAGSQLVITRARHEILQEQDEIREEMWAAFDAFIPGSAVAEVATRAGP